MTWTPRPWLAPLEPWSHSWYAPCCLWHQWCTCGRAAGRHSPRAAPCSFSAAPQFQVPSKHEAPKQNYLPKEKRYTEGYRGGFNNKLKHHHTRDGSSSCPNVDKKMLPLKSDWNQTRKPTNCEDCDLSPWQNWKDSRKNKQNNNN